MAPWNDGLESWKAGTHEALQPPRRKLPDGMGGSRARIGQEKKRPRDRGVIGVAKKDGRGSLAWIVN